MTDFFIAEKINMMLKNISKPRLIYRKGISLGGFFRPYMSCSELTKAILFSGSEVITPVTIRFSALLGDESTPDTIRNIKKMEVRFFTLKGCYDMLCQNIPVQFINEDNKLFELFDAFKTKNIFSSVDKNKFWKFVISNPESINAALHFYSSECMSDSFIDVKWYSVNLVNWINENGQIHVIRMKWVPIYNESYEKTPLSMNSAQFISGFDPDVAHNEVIDSISVNKLPKFELQIQAIDKKDIDSMEYYDPTLIWDERKNPFMPVGILLLNKVIPNKIHNEICYLACNTIEGIELCRNDITDIFDYIYKMEAMERGVFL